MLAATVEDISTLRYPLLASAKLDGVRMMVIGGIGLSRNLKPIPNFFVQQLTRSYEGYDGELIVGSPVAPDCYRKTMSGVMSRDGQPHVCFYVFDYIHAMDKPFHDRMDYLTEHPDKPVKILPQVLIENADDLLKFEENLVALGYEGVMLRDPEGRYKQGRSTLQEGWLMKLKRFKDDEGVVVGFDQFRHNANEAKTNALGYIERSSHKENQILLDKLGALTVRWRDIEFNIGTGFTDAMREEIWHNQGKYLGKLARFKYLAIGMKDRPRHPVFLGWRDPIDA